jgi:hypothetical protein
MAIQIVCANKPSGNLQDPHEAISDYGWVEDNTGLSGIWTRQIMVNWVRGGGVAYVGHPTVICEILISPRGTEYLRTKADGIWRNDLISLNNCRI